MAAVAVVAVATFAVVRRVAESRRLREIRVEVDLPGASQLESLVTNTLRGTRGSLEEGSTVVVSTHDPEAAPGRERDPGSPGPSRSWQQADVRVGYVDSASGRLIAFDPYVLVVDRRFGSDLLDAAFSLSGFADAVLAAGAAGASGSAGGAATTRVPLAVAGDEPIDFAGFLLYLAGELLPSERFAGLVASLHEWAEQQVPERADGRGAEEDLSAAVSTLSPVLGLLDEWRNRGILAVNWTDWDDVAVRQAIRGGESVAAFRRRSELTALGHTDAFFLRSERLPVGEGRRSYRLYGRAIGAGPGRGPRADAAQLVTDVLLEASVQTAIERETAFSPVVLEGDPLNRSHRDVVRWYRNAERLVVADESIAAHPLFERLKVLLR